MMDSTKATIADYDPNKRWAAHLYEVTLMQWDFSLTIECSALGNCRGFDTLRYALENYADRLFEEQGENPVLVLKRPASDGDGEDTLECSPDGEYEIDDWLNSMVVAARLVGHAEYKKGAAAEIGRSQQHA